VVPVHDPCTAKHPEEDRSLIPLLAKKRVKYRPKVAPILGGVALAILTLVETVLQSV